MRDYLTGFFDEFEYDAKDAEFFIGIYDSISADGSANQLLCDALAAYGKSAEIDYTEEIRNRAKEIARLTSIHIYTVELLTFICMTRRLKERYLECGLDMLIYRDSVLDLKWKLEECKAVKGIRGSFVAGWFAKFFRLKRFALGRLQFEITTVKTDYEKNGVKLEKDVSKVINVHIPRTGTPLDKESCDAAYARAREFFESEVGKDCPFVCESWLLYPENKDILPSRTNTYRFMSEYDVVDWGLNEGQDLWRLFDTDEVNPERLLQNTSMRRCYVEHLKNGGRVGWGYGIRL